MRRLLLPAISALVALAPPSSLAEGRPSLAEGRPMVEVVKVDGVIDDPMADYLIGSLEDAERAGAVVVIQLDSPGTLGVPAVKLAERVFEARVPVVVWVGLPGARVSGGAVLLLYVADLAATSPGSGIGPLVPLDLAQREGGAPEDLAARAAGWVGTGGSEAAFPDRVLTAQEALDRRIVQLSAASVPELLNRIDGARVAVPGGVVTLATRSSGERQVLVRFHDLGPARRVLHAVATPVAVYVLLVLGVFGLAFELTQMGLGVAGLGGAGALALAGYGLAVVPPWWPGLAILLLGLLLLALDVQLRRLGTFTLLGLGAFVAGSLLAYRGVSAAIDVPPWLVAVASLGSALYFGFALTVAIKARERFTSTRSGLIGLVGEARGLLDPDGPVSVKGTLWRGRALDGPIAPGTRIRVRGVEGLLLRVEPEEEDG